VIPFASSRAFSNVDTFQREHHLSQLTEENPINLAHYWYLIRGRIWHILGLAMVITVLVGVLVNAMSPVYKATAVLLLEPEQAKAVSMEDLFNVNTGGTTYFNTQREIMRSRRMLEQVVDKLNLHQSPEFGVLEKNQKDSWAQSLFKFDSDEKREVSVVEQQQAMLGLIKGKLEVNLIKRTKLIEISFESHSAQMAADVANTLVEVYIRDSLESRIEMTRQATGWMRERTTSLKQQLSQAENKLQTFIEQEGLVVMDSAEGVESLSAKELTELTSHSLSVRAKVAELSQRYGSKHPKLIAAKSELAQAKQAMRRGKSEFRILGRKGVKLKELKHEVESIRQLYETFVNRVKETDESSTLKTATARMIDSAIAPLAPIKPKKRLIVIAAFILTLAAGIGLVFLLDMLNTTIRSVEQVESRLGIALLGLLPLLAFKTEGKERASRLREMVSGDNHQFTESIRTIRTGIMLSAIDNPHKVILVTSSTPGEGKSTVAANLAIAMGKMEKVLLIDADMRRPTVAKYFNMAAKVSGLSELVAGTVELKDCLEKNQEFGIHVMHAGMIPPNPQELLASNRFKVVLSALEKHYDRIIIDSTPIQAVSDSLVLCQYANGVVYVVKADSTSDHIIKTCLKRLRQVDAPIIGVVLNQLDTKKGSRYGYDGYGGYYDEYGYSSSAEKA